MGQRKRVTAKKYMGDDLYSWAVFIDGHPFVTGLGHSEVPYYKKKAEETIQNGTNQVRQGEKNTIKNRQGGQKETNSARRV